MLWHMTIGQVYMYLQYANEKPGDDKPRTVVDMSPDEVRELRDQLRAQYGEVSGG